MDVGCQRRPAVGPRKNRTRTKSFTEALKEKYCTEEDWDTERYQNIKIVTAGRPKIKNKDGEVELGFLTNVVSKIDQLTLFYKTDYCRLLMPLIEIMSLWV